MKRTLYKYLWCILAIFAFCLSSCADENAGHQSIQREGMTLDEATVAKIVAIVLNTIKTTNPSAPGQNEALEHEVEILRQEINKVREEKFPRFDQWASSKRDVKDDFLILGSDSMKPIATALEESFHIRRPQVQISVVAPGSEAALPVLLRAHANVPKTQADQYAKKFMEEPVENPTGAVGLGVMSRAPSSAELDEFERLAGIRPRPMIIAYDRLAIIVSVKNPFASRLAKDGISIPVLKGIYSNEGTPITTWGQVVGIAKDGEAEITPYRRNDVSGTCHFFRERFLGGAKFTDRSVPVADSETLVKSVAKDEFSIGFVGLSYALKDRDVIPLPVVDTEKFPNQPLVMADPRYPGIRPLFVVFEDGPQSAVSLARKDFLKFANSREGREAIAETGYYLPEYDEVSRQWTALFPGEKFGS